MLKYCTKLSYNETILSSCRVLFGKILTKSDTCLTSLLLAIGRNATPEAKLAVQNVSYPRAKRCKSPCGENSTNQIINEPLTVIHTRIYEKLPIMLVIGCNSVYLKNPRPRTC